MAIWPEIFPPMRRADYKLTPQQSFIRSQVDQGPAFQRQIYSSASHSTSVSFIFRDSETFQTFEAWWKFEIGCGSDWFQMPIKNGSGLTICDVRFTSAFSATPLRGDNTSPWLVTGQIEIRNMPTISEDELASRLTGSSLTINDSDIMYDDMTMQDSTVMGG